MTLQIYHENSSIVLTVSGFEYNQRTKRFTIFQERKMPEHYYLGKDTMSIHIFYPDKTLIFTPDKVTTLKLF